MTFPLSYNENKRRRAWRLWKERVERTRKDILTNASGEPATPPESQSSQTHKTAAAGASFNHTTQTNT